MKPSMGLLASKSSNKIHIGWVYTVALVYNVSKHTNKCKTIQDAEWKATGITKYVT